MARAKTEEKVGLPSLLIASEDSGVTLDDVEPLVAIMPSRTPVVPRCRPIRASSASRRAA